ncbi:MAG: phosphoribosyl-ATP diphosphatase [Gammaproteobacteria bacterium]|nr:phosphoribosyl-ATP diphosphatase [Gammaproteobacteria bacterium]
MDTVLADLARVLEQRKQGDPETSYVARLYNKGLPAILKKVGEEATEVVIAGQSEGDDALVREVADLWFHTLVLLAYRGLGPGEVLAELERRGGISGIEEKNGRAGR